MTKRLFALTIAALLCSGAALAATTIFGTAYTNTNGAASLYSISPTTGAATLVGATGFRQISALAFAPNGTLYGIGRNGTGALVLLTINTATGAGTQVGSITV